MDVDVEYLRAARKARGLSQTDVARLAGLPESSISNVETGRTRLVYGNAAEELAKLLARWKAEDSRGVQVREDGPTVMYVSYQCKKCWHMTPGPEQGGKWCMACGESIAGSCPTCHASVQHEDRFCAACGHMLRKDGEEEEETGEG